MLEARVLGEVKHVICQVGDEGLYHLYPEVSPEDIIPDISVGVCSPSERDGLLGFELLFAAGGD